MCVFEYLEVSRLQSENKYNPLQGITIMASHILSDLVSYFTLDEINIENWVFKLYYKVSTVLCMMGTLVGVAQTYFGKPISCDFNGNFQEVASDYCWMHGSAYIPVQYQVQKRLTNSRNEIRPTCRATFAVSLNKSIMTASPTIKNARTNPGLPQRSTILRLATISGSLSCLPYRLKFKD